MICNLPKVCKQLKLSQNKKGRKIFLAAPFFIPFSQLQADSKHPNFLNFNANFDSNNLMLFVWDNRRNCQFILIEQYAAFLGDNDTYFHES